MIYFLQNAGHGPIKIGYTSDKTLLSRIRDLQCGNPYPLIPIGIISGSLSKEAQIHDDLKQYKGWGEWFSNCPEVIEYMLKLKGMKPVKIEIKKSPQYDNHVIYYEYKRDNLENEIERLQARIHLLEKRLKDTNEFIKQPAEEKE